MLEGRGCDLARYGRARWVWWGGVGRIVVDVEPVATKPSGQPHTAVGLPG